MAQPKRRHRLQVRFTDQEFAALSERAATTCRPLARFVREAVLGVIPRRSPTRTTDQAIHRLSVLHADVKKLAAVASPHDRHVLARTSDEIVAALRRIAGS